MCFCEPVLGSAGCHWARCGCPWAGNTWAGAWAGCARSPKIPLLFWPSPDASSPGPPLSHALDHLHFCLDPSLFPSPFVCPKCGNPKLAKVELAVEYPRHVVQLSIGTNNISLETTCMLGRTIVCFQMISDHQLFMFLEPKREPKR